MSRVNLVQRSYSILTTLTSATASTPITLAHIGGQSDPLQSDPNYRGLIGLLSNLRAISYLSAASLAEVALPELNLADSDTDRMVAILNTQWRSPRIHAEILISPDGTNWTAIALVAFLNSGGYPFSLVDLLPYLTSDVAREFPAGIRLGVRLIDAGYGLIKGGDRITFDGNWVEEYALTESMSSIGTVVTPDMTAIEGDILDIKGALTSVAAELALVKLDLADDPEQTDINLLNSKLDQIIADLPMGGGAMRSNASNESQPAVSTVSSTVIGGDLDGTRISVLIANQSTTNTVFLRVGLEAATASNFTFRLEPLAWVELATGEAIQAIALGSGVVAVTEFLSV